MTGSDKALNIQEPLGHNPTDPRENIMSELMLLSWTNKITMVLDHKIWGLTNWQDVGNSENG